MGQRQYRGISKYNYYRLKKETWDQGTQFYLPAGMKILRWAGASHSVQHTQSRYYFVTTNPVDGPVVRQLITARAVGMMECELGEPDKGRIPAPVESAYPGSIPPVRVFKRISMRPDKQHAIQDSETRGAVAWRRRRCAT